MNNNVTFHLQPTLENDLLLLSPLKEENIEELYAVASDPLVWEQHPAKDRYQRPVFELLFKDAMQSGGAFAVIEKQKNQIIGSTRFHAVEETANAIEIGWTFLARKYWGGHYNRSMKQLMIDYAFDFVDNILFYIDVNNLRSQKAVEKIGGKRITVLEGKSLAPRPGAGVIYNITNVAWKNYHEII